MCQLKKAPPIRPLSKTLVNLNLAKNDITHIPPEYFRGFDLLERISLQWNRIANLPEMYHLNGTLMQLTLHWNRLEDIKALYFVSFEKINTMNLRKNYLTNLSFGNAMWPAIEALDLAHNLISTINPFQRMAKGATIITLINNPLHCNRDLCWLSHCRVRQMDTFTRGLVCSDHPSVKVVYQGLSCNSPTERNMTDISESGTALNGNNMGTYVWRYAWL